VAVAVGEAEHEDDERDDGEREEEGEHAERVQREDGRRMPASWHADVRGTNMKMMNWAKKKTA